MQLSLLPPEKLLQEHITKGKQANKQEAKLLVLSSLLDNIFGVKIDELIPGIEKNLKSKILGVKGSADLIFSNVVIEIKLDIEREMDDARRELIKYLQSLLEAQPNTRHIGVVTDVIRYKAFLPVIKNDRVVDLKEISSIDMTKVSPADGIFWLDSFLFSKYGITPTADDLKWRFGPASPTYGVAIDELTLLWNEIKNQEDIKLKMNLWAKNMQIVYGSEPEARVFIDHTYLVTLVKLIIYLRLSGSKDVSELSIFKALSGEYFSSYGITNLIEEDFFSWILDPKVGNRAVKLFLEIAKELLRYDISQIDEDLFKEIYQEIVERGERHRIGEYYTPEWLTELTINEAIHEWQKKHHDLPRILDPACGSGTFLVNCIRLLSEIVRKNKVPIDKALAEILDRVVGVDVNPLAVIIAKANYIIALGELMQSGKNISVPIFTSDSVKIPTIAKSTFGAIDVYNYTTNGSTLQLPVRVVSDRRVLAEVLDAIKVATSIYRKNKYRKEAYSIFQKNVGKLLSPDENDVLQITLDTVMQLIDKQLDSIWIFMLNNVYAPIALKEKKFDLLLSNPPWIALRFIENMDYQNFLKDQTFKYDLLNRDQVHLFAHIEMATLFLCRSADLYLKNDGIIAFVMPRSVLTGALHHENFRDFHRPRMRLIRILDFEDVTPLFNVPACVLLLLNALETNYPVLARRFSAKLDKKNSRLIEVTKNLKSTDYRYTSPKLPKTRSVYYDSIRSGGYLAPRSLWFIDFAPHRSLGMDLSIPSVESSKEITETAKTRWKEIKLQGNVESDLIFATLLSRDIVPFGYAKLRAVVLPLQISSQGYDLLDVKDLRNKGYTYMAQWMEKVQSLWEKTRTDKDRHNFPRAINRLDYQKLLSRQNPKNKYLVLYARSGTNLVSCVVNKFSLPHFQVLKFKIKPRGFIADVITYLYETDNEQEAYYICSLLNSNAINKVIKPLQTRGLFGERDIYRRPFMFPIPKFDNENAMHEKLAKLGKIACEKVIKIKFTKTRPSGLRKEASNAVQSELKQIDDLVKKLLNIR